MDITALLNGIARTSSDTGVGGGWQDALSAPAIGGGAVIWKTHFIMAAVLRGRIEDHELDEEDRERTAAMARRLADRLKRRHPGFSYEWFFGACGLDHWGELPPSIPYLRQRVEAEPNGEE